MTKTPTHCKAGRGRPLGATLVLLLFAGGLLFLAAPEAGAATSCASCHEISHPSTGNCGNCHGRHRDILAGHDKLSVAASCVSCHATGGTMDAIATLHGGYNPGLYGYAARLADVSCAKCHATATSRAGKDVQAVIDAGVAGSPVTCTGCHGEGHAAAHNETIVPSTVCASCHDANVATEHLVNRGLVCATCHNSTRQQVLDTIAAGKAGTLVSCDSCHFPRPDHLYGHNSTKVPDQACAQCHQDDVSTEHGLSNIACNSCHDGATYRATIQAGKAGTPVTCNDCHNNPAVVSGHPTAHDMVSANTECGACHNGSVPAIHLNDCATCHRRTSDAPSGITAATISGTIAAGKNGTAVFCSNCHGDVMATHGSQHDTVGFPTNPAVNCAECHNANVVAEHVDKRGLLCTVCHTNPQYVAVIDKGIAGTYQSCEDCHGVISHAAAHDMTKVPDALCSGCHANNVVDVHLPAGTGLTLKSGLTMTCATCHNSTAAAVQNAIASGKAGNTVTCTACHATPDHTTQHDMTDTTSADCKTCHAPNVVTEHVAKRGRDCAICHSNPAYDSIIAAGRAGTKVLCSACHGNPDHTAAHDMAGVPATKCTTCHSPNMVTEHVTNRGLTCATCHSSTVTAVKNAITSGMAGTAVTCLTCHGTPQHHDNDTARTGKCTVCHKVPASAADVPVQAACRQCHISTNGFVMKKDFVTENPSHRNNTAGAIQDFGACFACHAPVPYHAKPSVAPQWWETSFAKAPGRGTFNLFRAEFRRQEGHYESSRMTPPDRRYSNMEDYGEKVIKPVKDSPWRTPTISFQMVTVQSNGKNYSVPAFSAPTSTSTSGSTTTQPSATAPVISKLDPTSGKKDDTVRIYGSNFGNSSSDVTIKFGDKTVWVRNWSKTQMEFRVPDVSNNRSYSVYITVKGVTSNKISFYVRD